MAVNYSGGVQGALGGAGTGASIGSVAGPWGTGIGALLGALFGGGAGLFGGGEEGGVQQAQTMNPQQQQILQFLLNSGQQQLQNPYQGFEPIGQAATSDFFQNIVPQLQHQFSASGSNAISSPQLQTNLSSAGAGLAERLAAMKAQYGQQNKQNGMQQLQLGLQPSFENFYKKSEPGAGENLFSSLLQNAPSYLQTYSRQQELQQLLDAIKAKK